MGARDTTGASRRSRRPALLRRWTVVAPVLVALVLVVLAAWSAVVGFGEGRHRPSQLSGVQLEEVDGGIGYYGRFSNHLPTSSDWFPVAVWGSYDNTQENRDLDAAAGINTYVWVADSSFMDEIRADGRFQLIQNQDMRRNVGTETAGWVVADEIDMQQPNQAAQAREQLGSILSGLPRDGRLRYVNYGKGVTLWNDDSDAARFVNLPSLGVVSDDVYWFTDPYETGSRASHVAASYGDTVRRMRYLDGLDGRRKPIWNFVEAGWPFDKSAAQGARSIRPAELRAAVWHSLIAGARGIIYFQHSFGGPCAGDYHVIRTNCEGTRPMVTAVDAQIKSLAPVLNSPTVSSGTSASPGIRTMVKWNGRNLYVFAGATGTGSSGRIDIPCTGDATATVLGENRTVPVSAGSLRDQFADANAIHIYRIDGGSTCGLPGTGPAVPSPGRPTTLRSRIGRLPRRVSLRSGRLRVPVACAKPCTVRSRLTTRATRPFILGIARRRFDVGRHTLVVRLSRRARRMARRRHRPFAIRLVTVLVDPDGRLRRTQRLSARRR